MGMCGREGFDTPLHHPENLAREMVDLDVKIHWWSGHGHDDNEKKSEDNGESDPEWY